jgi:type IV pilus assembly protein PilM
MSLPDFFGLDIGNHSIKVCQIKWGGNKKPSLVAIGSSDTTRGIIGSESEEHQKELARNIIAAKKDAGISVDKLVVGLPEARIFSQLITTPKVEDKKIEELIHWEAKKYIPIPIDEVIVDWIYLGERYVNQQPNLDFFIIAAPKVLIDLYKEVMQMAKLEVIGIETEAIATTRALWWPLQMSGVKVDSLNVDSVMILDFGAKSTDLSVVQNGSLLFSQSLVTGSEDRKSVV